MNDFNKNNCYEKCSTNHFYFNDNGIYTCTTSTDCPEGYRSTTINSDIKRCDRISEEENNEHEKKR